MVLALSYLLQVVHIGITQCKILQVSDQHKIVLNPKSPLHAMLRSRQWCDKEDSREKRGFKHAIKAAQEHIGRCKCCDIVGCGMFRSTRREQKEQHHYLTSIPNNKAVRSKYE